MKISLTCLLLLLMVMACAKPSSTELPHDSYIWQRVWTPALLESIRISAPYIRQWRVLAAENEIGNVFRVMKIDTGVLRETAKEVTPVFRLNGGLPIPESAEQVILKTARVWRQANLNISGIEIDYDCPTSKLAVYMQFLSKLSPALHKNGLKLNITALPTWLNSLALVKLLSVSDEVVLQTHAVLNPTQGLFDAKQALAWIKAFAAISPVPFRVALPNYGSRVVWNAAGHIVNVESESSEGVVDAYAAELSADPLSVAEFVSVLKQSSVDHLVGLAWFRLPTAADVRAWSLQTWLAVLKGEALTPRFSAQAKSSENNTTFDILLSNDSAIDGIAPHLIRLQANLGHCLLADGLNHYQARIEDNDVLFALSESIRLRAYQSVMIGWAHCDSRELSFEVHS